MIAKSRPSIVLPGAASFSGPDTTGRRPGYGILYRLSVMPRGVRDLSDCSPAEAEPHAERGVGDKGATQELTTPRSSSARYGC